MATYSYLALGGDGEERGVLEADNESAARQELRARGVRVLELVEGALVHAGWAERLLGPLAGLLPRYWMPVRPRDQIQFFRQAALMLRSGHTVMEMLEATSRLAEKASAAAALSAMVRAVERGASLSAAMAQQKRVFSVFTVRMVEAGETGGELDRVFSQIADDMERKVELRRQLMAALTYPAIVVLASVGVVAFLVGGVIPKFAQFLTARGKALPWAAADLLAIAGWLGQYGWSIAAGLLAGLALVFAARTRPAGREWTDRGLLHVPLVGSVLLAAATAQMAWTLSMLLASGLSVMDSLRTGAAASRNSAFRAALERAAAQVLEGARLSVALTDPALPPMVRHMVAVGEKSGELVTVMDQVGVFYRKDLEARIKVMTALIEPALILFVGGIVGFVYFAFFQALFTVGAG